MWCKREKLKQLINFVFVKFSAYLLCVELTFLNVVCFGIAYNFDWGRHMQIRAGSREGTHAHCVFHACHFGQLRGEWDVHSLTSPRERTLGTRLSRSIAAET